MIIKPDARDGKTESISNCVVLYRPSIFMQVHLLIYFKSLTFSINFELVHTHLPHNKQADYEILVIQYMI